MTAGFDVVDETVPLDGVTLRLTGADPAVRGIHGWTLTGVTLADESLDGLPTTVSNQAERPAGVEWAMHPNGVTSIDHVVVMTPDLDRTLEALNSSGLDLRRIRETESYGAPMRQAFFKLGPVVLEVVSGDTGSGQPAAEAPSAWFGLAVNAGDLDDLAARLAMGSGRSRTPCKTADASPPCVTGTWAFRCRWRSWTITPPIGSPRMLDHVFTDVIGALRGAGGRALERQAFEERFQADVLLGDLSWETS